MPPPDVTITIKGEELLLSETNSWVCLFTEAPHYDHLYVYEPTTFVIFECREVLDKLMEYGYPMQVRRLPTQWDMTAFECYLDNCVETAHNELEDELDHLEDFGGQDEG